MDSTNILYGKKWAVCGDSFTNGDFSGGYSETFEWSVCPENIRHMVI